MEPWLSRKKGDSITHELPAKIFLQNRCRISRGKSRENFKDSVSNCKLVVQSKFSVCCKYPRQYFCKSSIMYSLAAVKAYRALRGVSSGSKWYALRIITSKASRVTSSRMSSRVWPSRKSPGNVEVWCRGLNPAKNHLEGLGHSKTVRQTKNILETTSQSPYKAAFSGLEIAAKGARMNGTRWRAGPTRATASHRSWSTIQLSDHLSWACLKSTSSSSLGNSTPNFLPGWWYTYPSEKYESQLGVFIIWQNKKWSKPPTSCCRQERRSTLHHEAQRGLIHFLRDLRTDLTDLLQVDLRTWSGADVCDSQCVFDCRIMVISWSFHGHFLVGLPPPVHFICVSCVSTRFLRDMYIYIYIYIYYMVNYMSIWSHGCLEAVPFQHVRCLTELVECTGWHIGTVQYTSTWFALVMAQIQFILVPFYPLNNGECVE